MIGIIDYNCGNITSINNMLKHLGYDSCLIASQKDLDKCKFLILPGVGSFDYGIRSFRASSFFEKAEEMILKKGIPTLGICLGMQLMTNQSQEGKEKGLGWFNLETKKFSNLGFHKIPNMGWNFIKEKNSLELNENFNNDRFYFVHSYYVETHNDYTNYTCHYAETDYSAIISKDNMIGVQFHPEKSHLFGMKLLKNILESKIE
jgi:imidazole glycerol phosphate synthase, glutamine amidotransferase subunit